MTDKLPGYVVYFIYKNINDVWRSEFDYFNETQMDSAIGRVNELRENAEVQFVVMTEQTPDVIGIQPSPLNTICYKMCND